MTSIRFMLWIKSRSEGSQQLEPWNKKRQYSLNEPLHWTEVYSLQCHTAPPITGVAGKGRWKPILSLPMDRAHMCTLCAFNRIVEKIVHLHFQFIWTFCHKNTQKLAIKDMQRVLSSTGAHGGNVMILKDEQ